MQLNIEKHTFFKMGNIFSVKSHLPKITNLKKDGSNIKGNIEIGLYYYTFDSNESFESINLPFELDLAELEVIDVKLVKTNVFVVEGNGINIEYELEIEYEFKKEEAVEIDVIKEPDIIVERIDEETFKDETENLIDSTLNIESNDLNEEEYLESFKEDTKEFYEEILEKNLRDNVEIISTKSKLDEDSFLSFFDKNISFQSHL